MKELSLQETKMIQIEILDYLDKFCKANNIKYSLACGSLLGAVRHKGYIPWDDDIDVYLERNDYDRLIALSDKIDKKYKFYSVETDSEYNYPFGKLSDESTILIEENKTKTIGINIDVFPLDSVENKVYKNNTISKKISIYQKLWTVKSLKLSKHRSFAKNSSLILLKIAALPFSLRSLAEKMNDMAKANNNDSHQYLFEITTTAGYKHPFRKDVFKNTVDILFEKKYYNAMVGYDEYLKVSFGDYMKLPPKEEQVTHHSFKAYRKI